MKNLNCELCKLVFDREIKTKLHYEDDFIMIVDCLTHKIPMVVLKDHRLLRTKGEQAHIEGICLNLFPDRRFRLKGMKSVRFHWHEHLVKGEMMSKRYEIAEEIKRKVNRRLKTEYGKEVGISSRQIMALIDVLAEYLLFLKEE